MPFTKRQLTWSEEVFAGLIVLALIIAMLVLWFGFIHPLSFAYTQSASQQSAGVYYSEDDQQWVTEQD